MMEDAVSGAPLLKMTCRTLVRLVEFQLVIRKNYLRKEASSLEK
jgi:hypothetical protein